MLAVHACDAIGMPAVVRVVDQPLCDASDASHAGMPLPARPHVLRKTHTGGLQSWSTMGRSETPDVAKVFVLASRGMDLQKAWEKCGSPTTWGNVQRRFKAAHAGGVLGAACGVHGAACGVAWGCKPGSMGLQAG